LISGDEAVARGAWEAGAYFASGYPGTPSTEILEAFSSMPGIYAEWSINEKVALEAATGASLAGVRSLVTMKHVGLNVALDAYVTLAYTGINGGLVLACADDPGQHSSQNEQDSRALGKFAMTPVLEPSDSREARDFTKMAFDISEEYDIPVMLRLTTRTAHSKSVVEIDSEMVYKKAKKQASVPWDKYVMMPLNAKKRRAVIVAKQETLKKLAETVKINVEEGGSGEFGFVTAGAAYGYVKEAFPESPVFKLGMLYPLPAQRLKNFAKKVKRLYVVEEVEPYVEEFLRINGIDCIGKDLFPVIDELTPDIVRNAVCGREKQKEATGSGPAQEAPQLPARPPQLCAECGHRGVFKVLSELKLTVMGDIGCYTLGALPPFSALHTCIDMGSAISHAYGFEKAGEQPDSVVSVIGDSTFMHSGITAVANMVYNGGNSLVIILDNMTTAMTGRQPHPAAGTTAMGKPAKNIDIERLLRGMGVEEITVIDPFKTAELKALVKEYLGKNGIKVIIARRKCSLLRY